jgi:PhzF family phenazine biosynthesis protein
MANTTSGTWYNFVTLDVFTTVPYKGNPLAIVHVPKSSVLTQEQKLKVAKEFNLSESVFLHEDVQPAEGRRVEIFTPIGEIPFAGIVFKYHLFQI